MGWDGMRRKSLGEAMLRAPSVLIGLYNLKDNCQGRGAKKLCIFLLRLEVQVQIDFLGEADHIISLLLYKCCLSSRYRQMMQKYKSVKIRHSEMMRT